MAAMRGEERVVLRLLFGGSEVVSFAKTREMLGTDGSGEPA